MTAKQNKPLDAGRLPLWKRAVYGLFTTPVFLLICEASLWMLGLGTRGDDPFIGFENWSSLFIAEEDSAGSTWMVTAPAKLENFNLQRFPRQKAEGSQRVFCLGGSTTYGRPYDASLSFCGWLQAFLDSAQPEQSWEVINAGGISYASYRVVVLMEEMTRYDPDYFIIYAGHNEFLERRSYPMLSSIPRPALGLAGAISHTHLFRAMNSLVENLSSENVSLEGGRLLLPSEVDEILNHSVGPSAYHRDEAFHDSALMHYRYNLERMVKIAGKAGAGVIFVIPAANLKDSTPFKSEHRAGLSETALSRWEELVEHGVSLQRRGEHGQAVDAFQAAWVIDDQYAELHFRLATSLLALDRKVEARDAFLQALNLDVAPLRAPEDFQRTVREVASVNGLPFVDYPGIVDELTLDTLGYPIPGREIFLDHVHPSFDATRALALALMEELSSEGVLDPSLLPAAARLSEVSEAKRAELTPEKEGLALFKLGQLLNWAGKPDEAYAQFLQSRDLLGDRPEVILALAYAGGLSGHLEEALQALEDGIAVSPDSVDLVLVAALTHRRLHGDENVLPFLKRMVEQAPQNQMAHDLYGVALMEKGQMARAMFHFRQALDIEPGFPEASYHLGLALNEKGRFAEAVPYLEVAVEADPEDALAHYHLGVALGQTSELTRSLSAFEEALRLDPEISGAQKNAEAMRARMRDTSTN